MDILDKLINSDPICAATSFMLEEAAAEITRLRAEQGWQDISTAPRDGTEIWLYCREDQIGPLQAKYCALDDVLSDAEADDLDYDHIELAEEDWFAVDFDGAFRLNFAPTHWRPLPLPPQGGE